MEGPCTTLNFPDGAEACSAHSGYTSWSSATGSCTTVDKAELQQGNVRVVQGPFHSKGGNQWWGQRYTPFHDAWKWSWSSMTECTWSTHLCGRAPVPPSHFPDGDSRRRPILAVQPVRLPEYYIARVACHGRDDGIDGKAKGPS